jgi:hypothetical protein
VGAFTTGAGAGKFTTLDPFTLLPATLKFMLAAGGAIMDEKFELGARLPLIADGKKSEGRNRGLPPPPAPVETERIALVGVTV